MPGSTTNAEVTTGTDRNRTPSEAVVEAVADAEGVEPTDLRPLYEVVDPDALDSLFRERLGRGEPALGLITFQYQGYRVQVDEDGRVTLVE